MAAKCRKDTERIGLSSGEEENHKSDTGDDTNSDQAKDKYPLQLWVAIGKKLQTTKKETFGMANGKKKERSGCEKILYPPQLRGIILVVMKW